MTCTEIAAGTAERPDPVILTPGKGIACRKALLVALIANAEFTDFNIPNVVQKVFRPRVGSVCAKQPMMLTRSLDVINAVVRVTV